MRDKVKILTLTGEHISLDQWQQLYKLDVGSNQIGKFFSLTESRFNRDIVLYGELIVAEPLMKVADRARELWDRPLTFSSFNRSQAKQDELRADPDGGSLRAETSPHVVKLAGDFDLKTRAEVLAFVPVLQQAAKDVHVSIRIGYREYLKKSEEVEKATGRRDEWTFVHGDVCPEYYGKGKPWHDVPHPTSWEYAAIW